ncbi:MAG: hypothetical protein U0470_13195 [Anaerolineae bacterium]
MYSATDLTLMPFEPTQGATPSTCIQNASARCTGVDVTFTSSAGDVRHCDIVTLQPGEAYQLDIRIAPTDGGGAASHVVRRPAADHHRSTPARWRAASRCPAPRRRRARRARRPRRGVAPTPSRPGRPPPRRPRQPDGAAERIYLPIARRVR